MKWKLLLYTILTLTLLSFLIFNTLFINYTILRTIIFIFNVRYALEYLRILSICVAYSCINLLLYSHLL